MRLLFVGSPAGSPCPTADSWDFLHKQIQECDRKIELALQAIPTVRVVEVKVKVPALPVPAAAEQP
ncbi:MAG: hypothetical protein FJ403_15915, partial [Verrucomicrobia bacterium]|nr:hypothetical protein [Verrucomicrobiota bacterium]